MPEVPLSPREYNLTDRKLEIITQLCDLITLSDNPVTLTNLVLDIAVRTINASKCSFMMPNDDDELYIFAARGFDNEFITRHRLRIGRGIAGTVAKKRRPIFVRDRETDDSRRDPKDHHYPEKSLIVCPVLCKNKLHGILNLYGKTGTIPFSDEEYELAQVLANHAAIALDNLYLLNQLRSKAAELELTNQKLIDLDSSRTEFLMSLSHELRNPLNAIRGSIYHLDQAENMGRGEEKEFYSIIKSETDKLVLFLENQLDFLMSGDIARQLDSTVVDLAEILEDFACSQFMKQLKKRKSINLLLDVEKTTTNVCGDKNKISQILQHIVEGLCCFMKKNDTLQITVDEGDFIHLRFMTSFNLPEAQVGDLFRTPSFHREDADESEMQFYLAKKAVELHQWSITARNSNDRFQVSLVIPKNRRKKIEAALSPSANLLLEILSESLGLDTCSLMLNDELTGELTIKSAMGLDEEIVRKTRIKLGDKICGWVALEGTPLFIENIENDARFGKVSSNQYTTKSLISLPLKVNDKVIGVLNMNNKKSGEAFSEKDLRLAMVIVERFAHILEKIYGNDVREKELEQLRSSLGELLDAQKKYHKKQELFPELVMQIMKKLDVPEQEMQTALYVSTTYDLGLMLMDPDVMNKKRLQESERNALRVHPYTTIDLMNSFEFSEVVKQAILHHHERFDGSGYPDGLKGEQIPLISRVIAVVDGFCAMIAKRPYRKRLSVTKALEEISNSSGKQYDPRIVDALLETCKDLQLFDNVELLS